MAPTTVLHSAPGAQLREMAKLARQLGDPVAQPFIGNRRLSRRRAAEIRHDAGAVLRGTRLAGK